MHVGLLIWLIHQNTVKKSWPRLRENSHPIFYVVVCNSLYYYIQKKYPLWTFHSQVMGEFFLKFFHLLIIMPLSMNRFLSELPDRSSKRALYILKWILVSSLVEWFGLKAGAISFKKGWNLAWSAFIYTFMYILSSIYQRSRFLAISMSMLPAAFLIFKFRKNKK